MSAGISWRGKAVVLCSTWLDSGELRELSARGASVGSISPIPGFDDAALSGGGRSARDSPVEKPGGVSRAARRGHRAASQAVLSRRAHLHRDAAVCPAPRGLRIAASRANPAGSFSDVAGTATHPHASFVSERRPQGLPCTARTPQTTARALGAPIRSWRITSNRAAVWRRGSWRSGEPS